MNELDRDLVSIFKTLAKRPVHTARQERAVADFRHIRLRLGDPSLCCLLDQCVQDVVLEPEKRRGRSVRHLTWVWGVSYVAVHLVARVPGRTAAGGGSAIGAQCRCVGCVAQGNAGCGRRP